jgi:hypothetical protein
MNFNPVFGVNTGVAFAPPAYINSQEIATFAVANDCWVQIRGQGAKSVIRVAGPLDKVELVYAKFKQYEQIV